MKPFDLEAALRGEPVVTRDGRAVTGLHKHEGVGRNAECLSGVCNGIVCLWFKDGYYDVDGEVCGYDLFMAQKKVKLFMNLNRDSAHPTGYILDGLYLSEELANAHCSEGRIAVVPIEFEV